MKRKENENKTLEELVNDFLDAKQETEDMQVTVHSNDGEHSTINAQHECSKGALTSQPTASHAVPAEDMISLVPCTWTKEGDLGDAALPIFLDAREEQDYLLACKLQAEENATAEHSSMNGTIAQHDQLCNASTPIIDLTHSSSTRKNRKRLTRTQMAKNLNGQLSQIRAEKRAQFQKDPLSARPVTAQHTARSTVGMLQQIRDIRNKYHAKWQINRRGKKRFWTLQDIDQLRAQEEEALAAGTQYEGDPMVRIGKQALQLTNAFRARNNLSELKWHQALFDIGAVHSKNMAEAVVPFGHAGFSHRVSQFPFHVNSAAENVAMSHGFSSRQVAKIAVDGWIDSPGHRRNLLSHHRWCAIGVYRNSHGAFYLTQLFGL